MNTMPMLETIERKHEKHLSSRVRRGRLSWFQRSVITSNSSDNGMDSSEDGSRNRSYGLPDLRPPIDVEDSKDQMQPDQCTGGPSCTQLGQGVDEHSLTNSVESNVQNPLSVSSSLSCSKSEILVSLADILNNDALSDVTLIGREGVQVRATRHVVSCQSPALHEVLYQEPLRSEVFIGNFGKEAIRALAQYCTIGCLDRSPLVRTLSPANFLGLVEVASIATMYGFKDLFADVDVYVNQLIDAYPCLVTEAYESANLDTPLVSKLLVKFIRERSPQLLLETGALKSLGIQRMQDLLNALMGTDGTRTFQYLKQWIDENGATEENMRFAKDFASRMFCLKSLLRDPTLIPSLQQSGFFDAERINRLLTGSTQSRDVELEPPGQATVPASPVREQQQPDSPRTPTEDDAMHASPITPEPIAQHLEAVTPTEDDVDKPKKSMSKKSDEYLDGLVYQLLFDGSVLVHTLETIESFEY
jgi:hypothetical protein